MIAVNPKMREMIARLKTMPAARAASLGNALGYFGVSESHVGSDKVTGALVIAIATYSKSEEIPLGEMSPEYIIQLNEAYQEKADEL